MAVRVGRWDCPTCGTKRILGPETRCPNCGSPRPKNVRFYLPDDAEVLDDDEAHRRAHAGADWICGHCDTQNKATDTLCNGCGNPRDEESQDVNLQERTYGMHEVPTDSFAQERTQHPLELAQQRPRRRSPFRYVLYAALVLLGGYLALRSFPRSIAVTVEQFRWERSLQVLHNEAVQKEDWSLPQGAFEVSSFQAVRSYRQVLRGYETRTRTVQVKVGEERYVCGKIDKGNGYFVDKYCTRPIYENREETYQEPVYDQVPVYDTKYRFKVMEWVAHEQHLLRAAAEGHEAHWPEQPRRSDPQNWKEGERTEAYYLVLREGDGDQHTERVGYTFWSGLSQGQSIKAKKSWLFDMYYGLDEPEKDR
ncbi:MAG: hypothetical protein OHK0039_26810 [Bacteroidia bacterium]